MKILITGGTGDVGKAVVARLSASGHDVTVIGRRPGMDIPGATYEACDILDYAGLRERIRGRDAVVHLAAVPQPTMCPAPDLFQANAQGTFNVFEACAKEGVGTVVQASSINALGCAWSIVEFRPRYFPVDEEHPTHTTDPYSFSKNVVEDIAAYYHRRDGIRSVSLRLPWVRPSGPDYWREHARRSAAARECIDRLLALPPDIRRGRIDAVRQWAIAYRAKRPTDHGAKVPGPAESGCPDRQLAGLYHSGYTLWTNLDERDSAQAVERALFAPYDGSHPLFVNDSRNVLLCESRVLAELFFPETTEWRRPVHGSDSLLSIDRARELIGFEPEHGAGSAEAARYASATEAG